MKPIINSMPTITRRDAVTFFTGPTSGAMRLT